MTSGLAALPISSISTSGASTDDEGPNHSLPPREEGVLWYASAAGLSLLDRRFDRRVDDDGTVSEGASDALARLASPFPPAGRLSRSFSPAGPGPLLIPSVVLSVSILGRITYSRIEPRRAVWRTRRSKRGMADEARRANDQCPCNSVRSRVDRSRFVSRGLWRRCRRDRKLCQVCRLGTTWHASDGFRADAPPVTCSVVLLSGGAKVR